MTRCPFCGSENITKDTPYRDKSGQKIVSWCCLPQKRNQEYVKKRFGRDHRPSVDEVSKW